VRAERFDRTRARPRVAQLLPELTDCTDRFFIVEVSDTCKSEIFLLNKLARGRRAVKLGCVTRLASLRYQNSSALSGDADAEQEICFQHSKQSIAWGTTNGWLRFYAAPQAVYGKTSPALNGGRPRWRTYHSASIVCRYIIAGEHHHSTFLNFVATLPYKNFYYFV
jgi:hypothetical protein